VRESLLLFILFQENQLAKWLRGVLYFLAAPALGAQWSVVPAVDRNGTKGHEDEGGNGMEGGAALHH
jgi:hypothetical protein